MNKTAIMYLIFSMSVPTIIVIILLTGLFTEEETSYEQLARAYGYNQEEPQPSIRVAIELPNTPTPAALERIFSDANYHYYLSSVSSNLIYITFEDGRRYNLATVISRQMVSMEDLMLNGLPVIQREH